MANDDPRRPAAAFLLSLVPSGISALLCALAGLTTVSLYLLQRSLELGTVLPDIFDGYVGVFYTNTIVQPLTTALHNEMLVNAVIIMAWGLLGLAVYLVIEHSVGDFRDLQAARNYIQLSPTEGVIRHASLRPYLAAVSWRIAVVVGFSVIFSLAVPPVLHSLRGLAPELVLGTLPPASSLWKLAGLTAAFAGLYHTVVVFLRLFLMRIRLFG